MQTRPTFGFLWPTTILFLILASLAVLQAMRLEGRQHAVVAHERTLKQQGERIGALEEKVARLERDFGKHKAARRR